MQRRHSGWTAATIAYGRNNEPGQDLNAILAEATHLFGPHTVYGRFEARQVETDLLRFGSHGFVGSDQKTHVPEGTGGIETVTAFTVGGTRTVLKPAGWDLAAGADFTFYGVPAVLEPLYGEHPVSVHVFVRLRPPAAMRMIDMVMTRPMH